MRKKTKDKRIKTDGVHRMLVAGLDTITRAHSHGVFLVDLEPAKAFIERYHQEHGITLSYDFLILRACALALPHHPEITLMLKGSKLVQCGSIDIGVSVAGKGNIAPVAVIEDADKKSLPELRELYKKKVRQARREEEENLRKMNRIVRWIPGSFIRKLIIIPFVRSQKLRRKYVGNFQITSTSAPFGEFHLPNTISTAFLLSSGGISKRIMVVDDKPAVRLSVYLVGQIDHRVLDGEKPFKFCLELKDLLEHPEKLA
ncbi:MAG: 2-oxo acid dehydrogenase subunit E2 [Thermodesulfobacteriota bacterium]|nr:2-oxo acid dehydrogenase subunit E2 [Thermodesulfobacteriota bacterium]